LKKCGDRKSIISLTYVLSIYIVHSRRRLSPIACVHEAMRSSP